MRDMRKRIDFSNDPSRHVFLRCVRAEVIPVWSSWKKYFPVCWTGLYQELRTRTKCAKGLHQCGAVREGTQFRFWCASGHVLDEDFCLVSMVLISWDTFWYLLFWKVFAGLLISFCQNLLISVYWTAVHCNKVVHYQASGFHDVSRYLNSLSFLESSARPSASQLLSNPSDRQVCWRRPVWMTALWHWTHHSWKWWTCLMLHLHSLDLVGFHESFFSWVSQFLIHRAVSARAKFSTVLEKAAKAASIPWKPSKPQDLDPVRSFDQIVVRKHIGSSCGIRMAHEWKTFR